MPAFDKEKSLILMVPGWRDKSIKIPMGLGLNAFFSLGRNLSEIFHGRSAMEAGSEAERGDVEKFGIYVDANTTALEMRPAVKAARGEMVTIRKDRGKLEHAHDVDLIDRQAYVETKKIVDDAEKVMIDRFNTAWNATMDRKP